MRRTSFIALLALTALAVASVPASSAPKQGYVKLVKCSLPEAAAVFQGRMTPVAQSKRMWMRFTLLARTGADGFRPVSAPGLGRWRKAKPGVGSFGYRQGVKGLPSTALHRMRVDFRWYAGDGRLLLQLQRNSPFCPSLSTLPNLRARLSSTNPGRTPGVTRYRVRVTNVGRAAATAVPVRLFVDGGVADTLIVPALAPGEEARLGFRGPDCGQSVRADADPDATILETSERDNFQELACAELPSR